MDSLVHSRALRRYNQILTCNVEVHPKTGRSEGMALGFQASTGVDDIFTTVLIEGKEIGHAELLRNLPYCHRVLPVCEPRQEGKGPVHRT